MSIRPRVLFVTDLGYEARGRRYGDEDVFLSLRLREAFDVALCHPLDAAALMGGFDGVIVRNSGPVIHYRDSYDAFRARAVEGDIPVYNPLSGRADMAGKQYLVDLTAEDFPVIPTVDRRQDLDRLPAADRYVVKPRIGADSIGLEVVPRDGLNGNVDPGMLIQPYVDFTYEVSFIYVDRTFHYAVRAPDPARRWELEPYEPTEADLVFAQRFVDWNVLDHGIQRVDACRTRDGELLLVELEDLNPYLSLDRIADETRASFVAAVTTSLLEVLGRSDGMRG